MKIHADKIESLPPYTLSVRDVRHILKAVPPAWIEGIKEVRLANSLEYYSPYVFFNRYDGSLTIYSRCGTKKQALVALLTALAAPSMGIRIPFMRRPSEANRLRLNQAVRPLAEELLVELTPQTKRGWWGHPVPIRNDPTE